MLRFLSLIVTLTLAAPFAAAQITGRVVVGGKERSGVVVSLERENGQVLHQSFTSSRGTFSLDAGNAQRQADVSYLYIVIREEGFKLYRQRVDPMDFRGGGTFAIFLEPEDSPLKGAVPGAPSTVDVRQLQAPVPERAVREYKESLASSEAGNPAEALEHLERAVAMAPEYYDAWIDLGGYYDRAGRHDDAMNAFLKANAVNSRGALAMLNIGTLYYRQGDRERTQGNAGSSQSYAEGRQWLEKSLDLDSSSATARFYLGATYFRLNLLAESEQMLQSALRSEKTHAQTRVMLMNVYSRQGRYQDALREADAFLSENADAPERENILRVKAQLEAALKR